MEFGHHLPRNQSVPRSPRGLGPPRWPGIRSAGDHGAVDLRRLRAAHRGDLGGDPRCLDGAAARAGSESGGARARRGRFGCWGRKERYIERIRDNEVFGRYSLVSSDD